MGTAAELFALIRAPAYKILVSDLQGPGQCRGEVEASQEGSLVLNLERSQQRPFKGGVVCGVMCSRFEMIVI